MATPTTLIALLKAVAFGWKQERLAESSKDIAALGKEIYSRLADLSGHFSDVGGKLGKAVESYNKAVSTLETRVLVSGRKFQALDVGSVDKVIDVLEPIDIVPRDLQAVELKVEGKVTVELS